MQKLRQPVRVDRSAGGRMCSILDKEDERCMYDIIPSSDRKAAKDIQKVTPYRGMTEMLEKASYDPNQRCRGCVLGQFD